MIYQILELPINTKIRVLSPIVYGEKGTFKDLIDKLKKDGYVRVIVDNNELDLMEEINTSINRQTGETDKLKGSVEDIKDLTLNINSDTQNMKEAISNLAGQAQILNGIIKHFDVNAASVGSDAIFGVDG